MKKDLKLVGMKDIMEYYLRTLALIVKYYCNMSQDF